MLQQQQELLLLPGILKGAPETPAPRELAFPVQGWGCSLQAGTEHTTASLPLRNTPSDNAGLATATAPRPNSAQAHKWKSLFPLCFFKLCAARPSSDLTLSFRQQREVLFPTVWGWGSSGRGCVERNRPKLA